MEIGGQVLVPQLGDELPEAVASSSRGYVIKAGVLAGGKSSV